MVLTFEEILRRRAAKERAVAAENAVRKPRRRDPERAKAYHKEWRDRNKDKIAAWGKAARERARLSTKA